MPARQVGPAETALLEVATGVLKLAARLSDLADELSPQARQALQDPGSALMKVAADLPGIGKQEDA